MHKRKVIYTCLVGNYDTLKQPLVIDDNYDYICYTNDIKEDTVGVWEIRPIPFFCNDNARLSRYVKILPHKVLQDYDYSLWIDGNIVISGSELYKIINNKIDAQVKIAQVKHLVPPFDCTYEEIKYAYLCGRAGFIKSFLQYWHLKRAKFPTHWGLFENNIILRKHNNSLVKKISEEWWHEFTKYTKRDQFNLMFVYWKNNYMPELLFKPDQSARNVSFLEWSKHTFVINNKFKTRLIPYLYKLFRVLD